MLSYVPGVARCVMRGVWCMLDGGVGAVCCVWGVVCCVWRVLRDVGCMLWCLRSVVCVV